MSDLIDRKEAVEAVKNEMLSWLEGDSHDYRKVVDAIMDLPTVGAIPISFIKGLIDLSRKVGADHHAESLEILLADWAERKEE